MTDLALTAQIETWPLREAFVIARGAKTEARVVVATVSDGVHTGRGECVPYPRYGETPESVLAGIEAYARDVVDCGLERPRLEEEMPAGAARNAIDCALWDFEAKRAGRRVADLAGLAAPQSATTGFTISLASPDEMAAKARAANRPLLKLKLGGAGDAERVAAVRAAVPQARLVADANESWTIGEMPALMTACRAAGLELVEQPLPAGQDAALAGIARTVPLCADESVHTRVDLPRLAQLYDAVNIKLDKTGGLTEAIAMADAARAAGLKVMVGCMVGTSLGMAPALLLAARATWIDLDGPLLLARDRANGLRYDGGTVYPPEPALWG